MIITFKKLRNKKYYRDSTSIVHPLYKLELTNAITAVRMLLYKSILTKAVYMREKALMGITLEKCWKNNNFSFLEAKQYHEILYEHD